MNDPNPKVNFFFDKAEQWQEEFEKLRMILLDTGLNEELKWGHPCYTLGKKNIVLIHGFKEYCALLFHKGSLLPDPDGILVQQTENVQAARQIRFKDIREIPGGDPFIRPELRPDLSSAALSSEPDLNPDIAALRDALLGRRGGLLGG